MKPGYFMLVEDDFLQGCVWICSSCVYFNSVRDLAVRKLFRCEEIHKTFEVAASNLFSGILHAKAVHQVRDELSELIYRVVVLNPAIVNLMGRHLINAEINEPDIVTSFALERGFVHALDDACEVALTVEWSTKLACKSCFFSHTDLSALRNRD